MGIFTWMGRVIAWFVFLPLGLYLSFTHGSKKRQKRTERAIRDQTKAIQQAINPQMTPIRPFVQPGVSGIHRTPLSQHMPVPPAPPGFKQVS